MKTAQGKHAYPCSLIRAVSVHLYILQDALIHKMGSIQVSEWLALPTSDHKVLGLSPAGDRIQYMTVWHFIA